MNDVTEWYLKHAKKLDKKYYNKGEPVYVLHRRTLMAAKSIIDLINDIPADDLYLELYMLVKDKNFGSFVGRYQYVLEMAKEKPDVFTEQLYDFYLKMASTIKKNNYYLRFFEFVSYFQNEDMKIMDTKRQLVYRAYTNLLMNQAEFLRKNKFEVNKMVAGVTTKGELIEVDDICPNLDSCVHEFEHIALTAPEKLKPDTMFRIYEKRGYKINSWEDADVLRVTQQLHTNSVAYLTPYINEFTIDIIPQKRFNPELGMYLKSIPKLLKDNDTLKETLCHRRKTLSSNGLKIHFENSTFMKDVLLKEIYHNGAIVCLYRMETTQGETAGFYNTQTKQFASMFAFTEEQIILLGRFVETLILWCYAAFVGSDTNVLPTSESYNDYIFDKNADVTFTSIGGKLRVPTEIKHIRTIAGDDRYESEIKHISGYIRKLPDGQKASERALALAQSLGYDLDDNETYVQPFERSSWIVKPEH
ncbi:hypothetical protein [Ruminococcus albus]|uniref:hypothetical protein n=1 Tax=Ruminococcus albus TaxID=1264 RepID=UPI0004636BB2|nr:hypothetical protein [Ruminococcus albus]